MTDQITAVANALEAELMRQYQASEWEEAKDVLEGVDYSRLALAALHDSARWRAEAARALAQSDEEECQ